MKCVHNERGIALVLALIVSLVVLAAVSALIYLVTQGTSGSGYQKRYQTSLEAAKGAVQLGDLDVISKLISSTSLATDKTNLVNKYTAINLAFPAVTSNSCLGAKLLQATANWSGLGCSADNSSLDLKKSDGTVIADLTVKLSGPTSAQDYNVFLKVVDTIPGNTDTGGLDLQGLGVVESGGGLQTPKQVPYMYRMEVQAERATNPDESARLSVLFAY